MHESIATALRRGQIRQIEADFERFDDRIRRTLPDHRQNRTAFLRHAIDIMENNPTSIVLHRWDNKDRTPKRRKVDLLTLSLSDSRQWVVEVVEIDGRKCDIQLNPLGIVIATHVIDRLLGRLNQTDLKHALAKLDMAILNMLGLRDRRDTAFLVGVGDDGALVVEQHKDAPGAVIAVTFLDKAKLNHDQITEVQANAAEGQRVLLDWTN